MYFQVSYLCGCGHLKDNFCSEEHYEPQPRFCMQVTWWLWAVLPCLNNLCHLHFQRAGAVETHHTDKSSSRETRLGGLAARLPFSLVHTLISSAAAGRES